MSGRKTPKTTRRERVDERNVTQGMKYLRQFFHILEPLRHIPVHGNREFFFDQYVALLLMHFYNPVLKSLRTLQEATGLENVQSLVGVRRMSLAAMSEAAATVFRPEDLLPILEQVSGQVMQLALPPERMKNLPGMPVAVDGTFLRCLPKMVWACFRKKKGKRGVQLQLHYDITRGIPRAFEVLSDRGSESASLKKLLEPGMLYITDRGYINYTLYQAIHDGGSFFVARLKDNSSHQVLIDRPLTDADRAAGVLCDQNVRMGSAYTDGDLTAPVRRVVIRPKDRQGRDCVVLTNTDLPADMVGLLYRYRWQVELFFKWFKCILEQRRHWFSQSQSGLTVQVYVALLASMLLTLWTGCKPNASLFRMFQLHLQGWAKEHEVTNAIRRHQAAQAANAEKAAAKKAARTAAQAAEKITT